MSNAKITIHAHGNEISIEQEGNEMALSKMSIAIVHALYHSLDNGLGKFCFERLLKGSDMHSLLSTIPKGATHIKVDKDLITEILKGDK